MSLLTAKLELNKRIKAGKPQPAAKPSTLALAAISELPEVFQHRRPLESASQRHIRELSKILLRGKPLTPVAVLWAGDGWVCIDGHHRLGAYRLAKWKKAVPVSVNSGSIDSALNRAAMNSHDRLQMHPSEKTNAAWRLVVAAPALSKTQITQSTGASDGTVGHMRRVHKRLTAISPTRDLSELLWEQARREYQGEPQLIIDEEAYREKKAQQFANTLHKALGNHPKKQPEAFADALEIYFPGLPSFLVDYWRKSMEDEFPVPDDDEPQEF